MDWQDALRQYAESNPDLPAGPDSAPEPEERKVPAQPRLDIFIERKGRGGKTATFVTGWTCSDAALLDIAAKLKQKLGTGGSARGGEILIQGDRRNDLLTMLKSMGYKARII
ncbi:MAG: translation initiation factor [Muribaculaceae bacterium]|nr:translation initiation factor [Muribaculaceae bacterium]